MIDQTVKVSAAPKVDQKSERSLSSLTHEILKTAIRQNKEGICAEYGELKDRQNDVQTLHNMIQSLHSHKDEKGEVDFSNIDALKNLVEKAKEIGVELNNEKSKYTKDELADLIANAKITLEDLNTKNDLQIQKVQRLTSQQQEILSIAKTIMSKLNDIFVSMAKAIRG